jgi:hypothetical protein
MTVLRKLEEKRREYEELEDLQRENKKKAAEKIARKMREIFGEEIKNIPNVRHAVFSETHGKPKVMVFPESNVLEEVSDENLAAERDKLGSEINKSIRELVDTQATFLVDVDWEGHQVSERMEEVRRK